MNTPPIPTPDGDIPRVASVAGECERGGCLTIFLISIMVAGPISGIVNIVSGLRTSFTLSAVATVGSGLLYLGCAAWAFGLWKWKKWGLYACMASAALGFALNLLTAGLSRSFAALLVCVVLMLLVRGKWQDFE